MKSRLFKWGSTLLASNSTTSDSDAYLLSIRILNYQLLHSSSTGGSKSITFLVLVTPDVPVWKRDHLEREGATIVVVEKLDLNWMTPLTERWRDVMVKLRLFQLTDYDRILFLDADTFLLKPLEKIFSDPAVMPLTALTNVPNKPDEAPLPSSYLFATLPEVRNIIHSYPPLTLPYFNAGFFILQPSLQVFAYYASLLTLEGRFDSTYPEQNLLNYAHRENGNMPWSRLRHEWNINLPNANDVQSGVRSVHSKLWTEGSVLEPTMPELRRRWKEVRDEMEEFYGNSR
ncbi:nucleotide-diphospho-sugar transferase [Bisporella sp. PMI_857]|nr:nucleotide-diphospho-sugar transferase [Bisporella sp. PMI_857]